MHDRWIIFYGSILNCGLSKITYCRSSFPRKFRLRLHHRSMAFQRSNMWKGHQEGNDDPNGIIDNCRRWLLLFPGIRRICRGIRFRFRMRVCKPIQKIPAMKMIECKINIFDLMTPLMNQLMIPTSPVINRSLCNASWWCDRIPLSRAYVQWIRNRLVNLCALNEFCREFHFVKLAFLYIFNAY